MTASAWSGEELTRIGGADELTIQPVRADGRPGRPVPIWVVRAGNELYIRSWRGEHGAWYPAATTVREAHISAGGVERDVVLADAEDSVNDAVDAGYRHKYARYPSYVDPMVSAQAHATTLRLVPREEDR